MEFSLFLSKQAAAPGDTIDFSVTGTIEMQVPAISISKNLTITGPGAGSLTLSGTGNETVTHYSDSLFNISSGIVGASIDSSCLDAFFHHWLIRNQRGYFRLTSMDGMNRGHR